MWRDFLFVEYRNNPIIFNLRRVDKGLKNAFKKYMGSHFDDGTVDEDMDVFLKKQLDIFLNNISDQEKSTMKQVLNDAAKQRLQRILDRVFVSLDPFNKGLIKTKLIKYWLELDRSWDINYGRPVDKVNRILEELDSNLPKSIDKSTFMMLFNDWGLRESLHLTPDGLFYERLAMYAISPESKRAAERLVATQRTDSIHDRRKSISTYIALQKQDAFV